MLAPNTHTKMKKKILIVTVFTALVASILWFCPGPTSGKFHLKGITTSGISYYYFSDGTIYATEEESKKTYELGSYTKDPDGMTMKINGVNKSFKVKFYLLRLSFYNSKKDSYVTSGYRSW